MRHLYDRSRRHLAQEAICTRGGLACPGVATRPHAVCRSGRPSPVQRCEGLFTVKRGGVCGHSDVDSKNGIPAERRPTPADVQAAKRRAVPRGTLRRCRPSAWIWGLPDRVDQWVSCPTAAPRLDDHPSTSGRRTCRDGPVAARPIGLWTVGHKPTAPLTHRAPNASAWAGAAPRPALQRLSFLLGRDQGYFGLPPRAIPHLPRTQRANSSGH
jgi:hypothetical protein